MEVIADEGLSHNQLWPHRNQVESEMKQTNPILAIYCGIDTIASNSQSNKSIFCSIPE